MALFADSTQLFYPVYSAFRDSTQSQASGWVTTDWNNVEIDTTEVSESNGIVTVQEAGYYFAHYNYYHQNGMHSDFRLRMHSNGVGDFAYQRVDRGDGGSISGFCYLAAGWYIYCQAYHSNTSHPIGATNRRNKFGMWRFNGGTDF